MRINKMEFKKRIERARRLAVPCRLCPRQCGVDRAKGEKGFCKAPYQAKVYSYRQYLGEEPPISGTKGSGVIFFSHCTMRCIYCQNFRFSQKCAGYNVDAEILCRIMLSLKERGCHNINLVTPSHYIHAILESLLLAKERSLNIPIVYNTSGYESEETLKLLEGVVDIYLANVRYSEDEASQVYSDTRDYVEVNRRAVSMMQNQVGRLVINSDGIAERGLIIRHLVIPNLLSNTAGALKYIAKSISKETYVSLMAQYLPLHKAKKKPEISRVVTQDEYEAACKLLNKYKLTNGWIQELRKF